MKSIRNILLIALLSMSIPVFAQTWSEPSVISQIQVSDLSVWGVYWEYPKYQCCAIDNLGIIHSVWKSTDRYTRIYYAQSTDDGDTWSEPFCLSDEGDPFYWTPSIVVDSNNDVHVSYSYSSLHSNIYPLLKKSCIDGNWSSADTLFFFATTPCPSS